MGIDKHWNIHVGRMEPGPRNLITDIAGLAVGHCTVTDGDAETGVTAVVPQPGNLFRSKLRAAAHVINGFGKATGLVQVEELGTLEAPVLLTNTLSVGTVSTAAVRHMVALDSGIGTTAGTVNTVVAECNDGPINDIRGLHVTEQHAAQALSAGAADFAEGAVGAGRGMRCHGLKGGIGSASRKVPAAGEEYLLGALVLSNQGLLEDLLVEGEPVGARIAERAGQTAEPREQGSIIMLLATDAPLHERQLNRVAKRAGVGLARTGSFLGGGSGDIVLALSTANRVPHEPPAEPAVMTTVHEDHLDQFFRAAAETVEEAILSSMLHAAPVPARDGTVVQSLAELLPGVRG